MDGNPMTAWTPRERALRAALEKVNDELCVTSPLAISRGVAQAFSIINAALADPPTPDPRDEALRLADDMARQLNTALNEMYQGACERIGLKKTAEKHSRQLRALANYQQYREIAAIRAAKGGA